VRGRRFRSPVNHQRRFDLLPKRRMAAPRSDQVQRTVIGYARRRLDIRRGRNTLFGMSVCCSLDEPGKPSVVEYRSRLPPSQIARASSARAPATRLTTMQACTSQTGHRGSCSPAQLQRRRVPAAARCPGGRRDAALAAGHACPIRGHAPVVPGCGSQSSD